MIRLDYDGRIDDNFCINVWYGNNDSDNEMIQWVKENFPACQIITYDVHSPTFFFNSEEDIMAFILRWS